MKLKKRGGEPDSGGGDGGGGGASSSSEGTKKIRLSAMGKSVSLAVAPDLDDDVDEEEEMQTTAKTGSREADVSTATCCIEEAASSETTAGAAGNEATECTSLVAVTAVTSASGAQVNQVISNRESMEAKRERKAAKTLVIITGAFVVCWLPFFVTALVLPICGDSCPLPDFVLSVFLWLGYVNSMINPIIYTIFSMDFRAAFKKILFGRRHRQSHANSMFQKKATRPAHV